nr:DUF6624 domain-containing protein [uncultured Pedobacter sp.]
MSKIKVLSLIGFSIFINLFNAFGQTNPYDKNIKLAEDYHQQKAYLKAAKCYSMAFASNKDRGRIDHRYNAAQCWAMAGKIDSAFYQLERIAKSGNYINYYRTTNDSELKNLHTDERWVKILDLIKTNKENKYPKLNEALTEQLDTVLQDDQKYRLQMDSFEKKFGWNSVEMKKIIKTISEKDSMNIIKIKRILDNYGWLGSDVIGQSGNGTLFLVIQHADQHTQEKYLPMMREAVKQGKAEAAGLALLEDRVAIRQGKKQIYGSQIRRNDKTGKYYVLPLENPEDVDQRRSEINLSPISEYVKRWGINWSVEQYKKDIAANNE